MRTFVTFALLSALCHNSNAELHNVTQSSEVFVPTPNDAFKAVASLVAGRVPMVGWLFSLLIGLFWPSSQPDQPNLWDIIEERIQEMIDKAIHNQLREERNEQIRGLRNLMTRYNTSTNITDKANRLDALDSALELYHPHFIAETAEERVKKIHILDLAKSFAYIHLSCLREYAEFGPELFGREDPDWSRRLEYYVANYTEYFEVAGAELVAWRREQVTTEGQSVRELECAFQPFPFSQYMLYWDNVPEPKRQLQKVGYKCASPDILRDNWDLKNIHNKWRGEVERQLRDELLALVDKDTLSSFLYEPEFSIE